MKVVVNCPEWKELHYNARLLIALYTCMLLFPKEVFISDPDYFLGKKEYVEFDMCGEDGWFTDISIRFPPQRSDWGWTVKDRYRFIRFKPILSPVIHLIYL